ncbi:hypothetical protein, partial [Pseudomonas sp. GM18]|uniref:hypothetical protein n=1 Tax=Pseudomonas sp. GM18 TaxID=1144324 RepID=UPI001EE66819
ASQPNAASQARQLLQAERCVRQLLQKMRHVNSITPRGICNGHKKRQAGSALAFLVKTTILDSALLAD